METFFRPVLVSAAVLAMALGLELLVGDPVSRWHPVALFGRVMGLFIDRAPAAPPGSQLFSGLALVAGGATLVSVGCAVLLRTAGGAHPLIAIALGAALLKTSFSLRQLQDEAARTGTLLAREGVTAARGPLSALVSRDIDELSPSLAASAAVESLAENLSDSFVAPLLYYVFLGVPGALAYRAINTLDAMIGYHGRYEYLGRAAAKLDDVASYIPARITAALLVISAGLAGANGLQAVTIGIRDHSRTASPNSGWPMAVMAGALETQLEKAGYYRLGNPGRMPDPMMIQDAIGIVRLAAALTCMLVFVAAIMVPLVR